MRLEFPGKVRDKAALRAGGRCEKCGGVYTKPEFDHILPDALGGKPELANCMVLCRQCHKEKTAQDVKRIRKADRERRAHLGAKPHSQDPFTHAASPRSIVNQNRPFKERHDYRG